MEKIGIFGGTFDPIHFGHLEVAQTAFEKYQLNKIIFLPVGFSPNKPQLPPENKFHRLNMINLAIENIPQFETDSDELNSGFFDITLEKNYQKFLADPDKYHFFYLLGSDSFLQIHTWKNLPKIFNHADLIVVSRPDVPKDLIDRQADFVYKNYQKKILFLDSVQSSISSSQIRDNIKNEFPIDNLVPPGVESYIVGNHLYK